MESIEDKIIKSISKRGRGTIFFSNDFSSWGEPKTVLKSLERLAADGKTIRLARGIYYYPKIDKVLGLGVLYPSYEEIASSVAKRDKARIAPGGAYAMNLLGLTTQVPMRIVFMTDGSQRNIKMQNGHCIVFRHTVPKNLSYQNKTAQLVCFALREIGEKNITKEQLLILRDIVSKIPRANISNDYKLMPAWIRTIVKGLYE